MDEASQVLQTDQAEKGALEKNGKLINTQINDMQIRVEEMQRALHEADGSKRKLIVEQCDLTHHLEEAERTLHQLSKDKTSLTTQLDDAKRLADAETRVYIFIFYDRKKIAKTEFCLSDIIRGKDINIFMTFRSASIFWEK